MEELWARAIELGASNGGEIADAARAQRQCWKERKGRWWPTQQDKGYVEASRRPPPARDASAEAAACHGARKQ